MSEKRTRVFAAAVDDVPPGSMREVPLAGTDESQVNALLSNVRGKFYATTASCSHYGLPLARGVLTGDGRLYCPFHGACFRVTTGDIEDAPALDPLKSIEVVVEDGNVYLMVDPEKLEGPVDSLPKEMPSHATRGHHTVFVGGGAVALHGVQEMRRRGYAGRITMLTAEPYAPIDRTKLSKGDVPSLSRLLLRDESYLRERLGVELRVSSRVYSVDLTVNRVAIQGGNTVTYDTLVLAPGSVPRRLPVPGADLHGVYLLRTLDDARAINDALARWPNPNLVIIGSGFIGLEMGVALARRANVTLLGQTHVPLEGPLGRAVGYGIQTALVNERGLKLLNAVDVVRIEADASGHGVSGVVVQPRARGSPELWLHADAVIMATGAAPATQFLRNSPSFPKLRPDGSVEVDSALRVIGTSNVFAGGDIAAYPANNGLLRIEHWNVASNHGREIGRTIATGRPRVFAHVPVFWSGLVSTLRYVGHGAGFDQVHVTGEPDEAEFVAYYAKDDRIIAVATMNTDPVMAKVIALMRAGRMPRLSDVIKGTDVMKLDATSSAAL